MRIDTSFPVHSKFFLCLDVPYRYAGRHFEIAFCPFKEKADASYPSLKERVARFSLGLLLIIPVIGHITAIANRILHPPLTEANSIRKEGKTTSPGTTDIPNPDKPKKTPAASSTSNQPTCPQNFLRFYEKASKKFSQKILSSTRFNEKEKTCLFDAAASTYIENLTGNEWLNDTTSMDYLKVLSMRNPKLKFSPVPGYGTQFVNKPEEGEKDLNDQEGDKDLNDQQMDAIVEACQGFSIFGHPLRVDGNHRTAFVIDLENKTVEYFNSFGEDDAVKSLLQTLAKKLSQKHGGAFKYIHKTKGMHLQQDVHQCGVWCCKLIEERVRIGKNFNPSTLKKYDIVPYRNSLFEVIYKDRFYQKVGAKKLTDYLVKNGKDPDQHPIWGEEEIGQRRSDLLKQLGITGKMPQELLALIKESEKK